MYPILALLFLISAIIIVLMLLSFLLKPRLGKCHVKNIRNFGISWFIAYSIFIFFFTGPDDLSQYPPSEASPYKLPWQADIERFVAQGNRSFTSHRGLHLYAWDFVMPNGTPVLAAREGTVLQVEVSHDGIGLQSNYVTVEHEDGDHSVYAHLMKNGSFVKVGDHVEQGQILALSGMVGQTLFPHLHFYVTNKSGTLPKKISFREVPGGVPHAGSFYKSQNYKSKE